MRSMTGVMAEEIDKWYDQVEYQVHRSVNNGHAWAVNPTFFTGDMVAD
jgi:hypothetical protein